MYVAKEAFNTPGTRFKKGDTVPFIELWFDAGLIEKVTDTKPHQKIELETKPAKRTSK